MNSGAGAQKDDALEPVGHNPGELAIRIETPGVFLPLLLARGDHPDAFHRCDGMAHGEARTTEIWCRGPVRPRAYRPCCRQGRICFDRRIAARVW